jgi:hypothetical protein
MLSRDLTFHIHGMPLVRRRSPGGARTGCDLCPLHQWQSVATKFMGKDQMERYVHPLPVYPILALELWVHGDGWIIRPRTDGPRRPSPRSACVKGNSRRVRIVNDITNALTANWCTGGACHCRACIGGCWLTKLCDFRSDVTCSRIYLEVTIRAGFLEQHLNRMSKKIWRSGYPCW